jgi:hypothetical protein
MGTLLSVSCAEQIPYINDATQPAKLRTNFLDVRVQEQRSEYKKRVSGPVPKDVHTLVQFQFRRLISGARDSVTPPDFADRAALAKESLRELPSTNDQLARPSELPKDIGIEQETSHNLTQVNGPGLSLLPFNP